MQSDLKLADRDQPTARTFEEGVAAYRLLIEKHHHATLAANREEVERLRHLAYTLAKDLNGDNPGILTRDGAGTRLEKAVAAPKGQMPWWGQEGEFLILAHTDMLVWVKIRGMIDMCGLYAYPNFDAHAVEADRPFVSETGYRSCFHSTNFIPGWTPDLVLPVVIDTIIRTECKKGIPPFIEEHYRARIRQEWPSFAGRKTA